MKILITGANGFIGSAIARSAYTRGFSVKAVVRERKAPELDGIEYCPVGDIANKVEWDLLLEGCDVVVHTAARVHMLGEHENENLPEYRKVNVEATIDLANRSEACGVRRFIYLSSIKVNGNSTASRPFTAKDKPDPQDSYGISKLEAETGLSHIATRGKMDVVILRPPLVYGPGVKANFLQMITLIDKGLPLPFGRFENKRSMVCLDNLVDLVMKCATEPGTIAGTYLVSDGVDVTFPDLLRAIGKALGKPAHLFNFSPRLLGKGLRIIGKSELYDRLCGSLQVDIADTERRLHWVPQVTMETGLEGTIKQYLRYK